MTVEIVYCAGWDPVSRSITGPLPESVARARDAAGEQYAFVLTGERPLVLVEVCWAAHYASVWYFDEQGRRERQLEFRRWPDERLRLLNARQWAYEPANLEFNKDKPEWRRSCWRARYDADGSRAVSGRWDGPDLDVPAGHPVPGFGEWTPVVGDFGPLTVCADPATEELGGEPPWQPALPLRPRQLDETFAAGARFELDDGAVVEVELASGGRLRLPSGRLIAADTDPWLHEVVPFEETVLPGEYPLQLSVVRFADSPEHTAVAACALWVSDRPTATWNNAWRDGEHPLLLADGEFFGVGADTGRVALVDAASAADFAKTIEDAYDEDGMAGWAHELTGSFANLITVSSGWGGGSYPVWVGRDDAGALTCFVVDFLVLAEASRLA